MPEPESARPAAPHAAGAQGGEDSETYWRAEEDQGLVHVAPGRSHLGVFLDSDQAASKKITLFGTCCPFLDQARKNAGAMLQIEIGAVVDDGQTSLMASPI